MLFDFFFFCLLHLKVLSDASVLSVSIVLIHTRISVSCPWFDVDFLFFYCFTEFPGILIYNLIFDYNV